ncbi:RNA-binding protein [Candidatus Saccharibacteria bacterium]|nr:RNA-binding protein [Candidatus Saccharibacteria bacterium]
MAIKLFVGKLSFDTTDDSLQTLFLQHGKVVSAHVIMDRETKRSKGFGFVEMEDQAAAQAAITALDGKEFEGRVIVVNIAKPREDRPQPSGSQSFQGGGYQRR